MAPYFAPPRRSPQQIQETGLKPKLLIVDDSRVSRMMIRARVEAAQPDWAIVEAASGAEALALLDAERPDYITMDVNMPGLSGFETVERIRQSNQQVKVVILTANIQEASRERAEKLAAKFVQKPVTEASIAQALDYFKATP